MADFAYFGNNDRRYKKEHYPIVEYVSSQPGWSWNGFVYECELIFILEGGIHISNGFASQVLVGSKRGTFLIPGNAYNASFTENTSMIRFRLDGNFPLREYFRTDKAELLSVRYSKRVKNIPVNSKLHSFLDLLKEECQKGAVDALFSEIKRKELFHILNNHYDRQEVLSLLYPLLSDNYSFMSFVYNNYHKVNSVSEFSDLANYSKTTFCDKFKAAFGVSVYRWLMEKRNHTILNELTTTKKQIKQIAGEQGFSSSSQFCDYCKKHFGKTSNEIRKNGVEQNNEFSEAENVDRLEKKGSFSDK